MKLVKVHQSCLVALIFHTKLYRKLAVSQTVFFVRSRELISRLERWKALKLGTIAYRYLLSKTVLDLGIFEIRSPFHFYCLFSIKTLNFANMKCLEPYHENETKTQKSPAPFCRPRHSLHVSTIKTCLSCSQIEINSPANTLFHIFRFFRNSPKDNSIFLTSLDLHFKKLSNKKKNHIKIHPQKAKITLGPTLTP